MHLSRASPDWSTDLDRWWFVDGTMCLLYLTILCHDRSLDQNQELDETNKKKTSKLRPGGLWKAGQPHDGHFLEAGS